MSCCYLYLIWLLSTFCKTNLLVLFHLSRQSFINGTIVYGNMANFVTKYG